MPNWNCTSLSQIRDPSALASQHVGITDVNHRAQLFVQLLHLQPLNLQDGENTACYSLNMDRISGSPCGKVWFPEWWCWENLWTFQDWHLAEVLKEFGHFLEKDHRALVSFCFLAEMWMLLPHVVVQICEPKETSVHFGSNLSQTFHYHNVKLTNTALSKYHVPPFAERLSAK